MISEVCWKFSFRCCRGPDWFDVYGGYNVAASDCLTRLLSRLTTPLFEFRWPETVSISRHRFWNWKHEKEQKNSGYRGAFCGTSCFYSAPKGKFPCEACAELNCVEHSCSGNGHTLPCLFTLFPRFVIADASLSCISLFSWQIFSSSSHIFSPINDGSLFRGSGFIMISSTQDWASGQLPFKSRIGNHQN